jgi:aminoglycoside phosphotransferase (APT) family kinase protein
MELLAHGRDADVFAIDASRVLRRCRNDATRCEREAAAMEWVRQQGYPVPRVHSVTGPDMVLERIEGPTMVECLMAGSTTIDAVGRELAELLDQLHALTPPPGSEAGHAVRHLDLHPFNVIASPDGPVVIDWGNTDVGPGSVDTALTAVILAQAALVPADLVPAEVAPLIMDLLGAFLRHAGPLDDADVEAAIAYRSRDPNLSPTETAALAAVPDLLHRPR